MNYLSAFVINVQNDFYPNLNITFELTKDCEIGLCLWFENGELSHLSFMPGDGFTDDTSLYCGQIFEDTLKPHVFHLFVEKLNTIIENNEEIVQSYGDFWQLDKEKKQYNNIELATEYAKEFFFALRSAYLKPVLMRLNRISDLTK